MTLLRYMMIGLMIAAAELGGASFAFAQTNTTSITAQPPPAPPAPILPDPLAEALRGGPESWTSPQRLSSTLQVMLRENPLGVHGLSIGQRLMYVATMWSYVNEPFSLVFLVTPVLYLAFGILPFTVQQP